MNYHSVLPLCPFLSVSGLSGLMDEEETALIDVMMCAMRQAAQATPPVGRSQSKKVDTH